MCLEHDLASQLLAASNFARQTALMGSDAACADNFLLTECHLSLCHYISTCRAGSIQQVVSVLPRHVDYRDLAIINVQIHLKKKHKWISKQGYPHSPELLPKKAWGTAQTPKGGGGSTKSCS